MAVLGLVLPGAAALGRRPSVQGLVLTALPDEGVAPLLVRFYLTVPAGPPPNLSWSFGDGKFLNGTAPSDDSPAHTYEGAGTFRCTVTAEWSTGLVNTSTTILVRPTNLSVAISAEPSQGPYPLTVWLNASVHGGTGTYVAFYWSFGDGNRGSGLSVRYTYQSPGRFSANFTATDSDNRSANASTTIIATVPGGPSKESTPGGTWTTTTTLLVILALAVGGGAGLFLFLRERRFPIPRGPPTGRPLPPGPEVARGPAASAPARAPPPGGSLPEPKMASPTHSRPPIAGPAALSSPSRITDALVRHLAGLPKLYPSDVPTRAWTQAGIADGIGAGQSAVSRVLRRLVAAGIVTVETRHVAGSPRRVRIYRLTERGERLGRALRETPPPGLPPPG